MRWFAVPLFLLLGFVTLSAQNRVNFGNIDDQTAVDSGGAGAGWGSCSDCAGGQNSTTQFSTSQVSSPSVDGLSREFYLSAQSGYTNALWWYKLGLTSTATRFRFDLRFFIDQNSATNGQAFEFDTFQFVNGQRYMFGMQCDVGSGTWDVWNGGAGFWVHTQLACTGFTPNTWHHLTLNYRRSSDLNMHYDSLTLDGVSASLGYTEPSGPLPSGWTNNLGVQFQLDTGANGGQMTMWVDNVSLTTWQ